MDGMTSESKLTYNCRYCEKPFRKETTLLAHLCEAKRRHNQRDETGVQWGLKSYLRFYEFSQGSAKLKSYEDFAKSPYYNAFVKFGRYCVGIRCINFITFTDWLLKNNKKLDHWCSDRLYGEWLLEYLKRENTRDALERAIKEMQEYAEINTELRNGFTDYFRYGNANRICHHITTGRISPWVIFNCDSGIQFLETLNETQLTIVMPWINPDYWQRRFQDYMADTEEAKTILNAAGL